MARHKDSNWSLPEGTPNGKGSTEHSWPAIHSAILMDIRDELKSLNAVLHCPNFLEIPRVLREIRRNTTKNRKKQNHVTPKAR